jgi:hypothetical protein
MESTQKLSLESFLYDLIIHQKYNFSTDKLNTHFNNIFYKKFTTRRNTYDTNIIFNELTTINSAKLESRRSFINFGNNKEIKSNFMKSFSILISYLDFKDIISIKLLSKRINDEIDNKIYKEYIKNTLRIFNSNYNQNFYISIWENFLQLNE